MTARTLYSCTMSLDGCMAGAGGDMHASAHLGPNPLAEGIVDQIGSLLVGGVRTTGTTRPRDRLGGRVRHQPPTRRLRHAVNR